MKQNLSWWKRNAHFFVSARGKMRLQCEYCGQNRNFLIHMGGRPPTVRVDSLIKKRVVK